MDLEEFKPSFTDYADAWVKVVRPFRVQSEPTPERPNRRLRLAISAIAASLAITAAATESPAVAHEIREFGHEIQATADSIRDGFRPHFTPTMR